MPRPKKSEVAEAVGEAKAPKSTKKTEDTQDLYALVASMKQEMEGLREEVSGTKTKFNARNDKVKIHEATLRQYEDEDGNIIGLVTKMYDVKEVKDRTEAKRFMGLCKIDVINPATGKEETIKDVDYTHFLNNIPKVDVQISSWKKRNITPVDKREGGGGIGRVVLQTQENEIIQSDDHEFEVEYELSVFELTVLNGEFEGEVITLEVDPRSNNIAINY